MTQASTQQYHRVGEDKRIQIITLRGKGCTLKDIARQTKVKLQTAHKVINKWKLLHTVKDLPKTGRPTKLDDRTRRRLARMTQSGEVSTASELAQSAASNGIVYISASTACRALHKEGLKAIHMVNRPLLTVQTREKGLSLPEHIVSGK